MGPSAAVLGDSWTVLGPSWGPLGRSWDHIEASWFVVGRRRAGKEQTSKSIKNIRKSSISRLFGLSWRSSWRPLGPSWRPLGSLLGRLGALLGRFAGAPERLGPFGAVFALSWGPLGPSWYPPGRVGAAVGPFPRTPGRPGEAQIRSGGGCKNAREARGGPNSFKGGVRSVRGPRPYKNI